MGKKKSNGLSASQMLAAKKDKKNLQNIKRQTVSQIGTGEKQNADRNAVAAAKYRRMAYLDGLKIGPPCDEDDLITDDIRNHMNYDALVYDNHPEDVLAFEKLIRAMKTVSIIYQDEELNRACNRAEKALNIAAGKEGSPNQRREALQPLLRLSERAAAYGSVLPEKTAEIIGKFCAGVQTALYSTAFYDRDLKDVNALNRIIRGGDLNSIAAEYDIDAQRLETRVLNAAWDLYCIAQCFCGEVAFPETLEELRRPCWLEFADTAKLKEKIYYIVRQWMIPFEKASGIYLINYTQFREKIIRLETNAANNPELHDELFLQK